MNGSRTLSGLGLLFAVLAGCSSSDPAVADEDAGDGGTVGDALATDTASGTDGGTDAPPGSDTGVADAPPADTTPADGGPPVGSTGCGKAATPGVSNGSITVGGTARTYVLSIPAGYDGKKPLPLAFGWHGRTGDGKGFRGYSGVEKAAGNAAIFVYPDGLTVTPSDPKDTGWELSAKGRDVALFDALAAKLEGELCVDAKRVFSFGFSFGGYMSNALACARPAAVRAIAPVAGGLGGGACGGPVAAWLAHATDDGTVNVSEGKKARDLWGKAAGCDLAKPAKTTPDPCVTYAGCSAGHPVVWCESPTGGHSWPSYAAAGIWAWFASQ